ncbi:hypothetical protein WAC51_01330 [Stenotrophomonas geniculata]|jgi:hypothetical protein|uniref:hypothetical protein n=1 Tax=Stenotrophomonas geniculata TaxID=86188 RepID=UPI0030CDD599
MSACSDGQTPKGLYREIADELRERTTKPAKHPSFVLFFLFAVLGLGALGIWVELYSYIYPESGKHAIQGTDGLRTAMLTFFPAVAGTAAMQLMWAESTKHFRSVAFAILGAFLVVALVVSPARITNASALVVCAMASVASLWTWWIANAKQTDLLDQINTSAAVGGDDVEVRLPGSLDDFQH